MLGDVNLDKDITISDVIALNKVLLGEEFTSEQQQINANVDKNAVIDSTDSLNILKYCVQLLSSFDGLGA